MFHPTEMVFVFICNIALFRYNFSIMLDSKEIRSRFLRFFEKRGHAIIPSASLVPENDPSVLFNTAGMQPLVPYLLGEPHPRGTRLADAQKCVRTVDIDEIGDNTHATFFEMLGNWSLGDYFKQEAITWSYEFLTFKEEGLGLDPGRLYVTVFGGNSDAPKDEEAYTIWKNIFERSSINPNGHIYFMTTDPKGKEPNWWASGDNGPCGSDTEMFYDVTKKGLGDMTKNEYIAADDRQDVVEIWNDVFMEYVKKDGKVVGKLEKKNVDTGSGLERITMVVQGKNNIFETDLLAPIVAAIKERTMINDSRAQRIIADHLRTSVFLIGDGVIPSNTDQGYILRRLLRRAILQQKILRLDVMNLNEFVPLIIEIYTDTYPNLAENKKQIMDVILREGSKFISTIHSGDKELTLLVTRKLLTAPKQPITGEDLFEMYSTHGFPLELSFETIDILTHNESINKELYDKEAITAAFKAEMMKHRELSRAGSEQKFKGGLADTSDMSVKYHTATHLLHEALRQVLGEHVLQKGSNITPERLRFDFSHEGKMTDEQKVEVEKIINDVIAEGLPVIREEVSYDEARARGAIGVFDAKYGDIVSIYTVGQPGARGEAKLFSLEFCGGPHVKNTNELGKFKIVKEEACSAGVRRIKAVLE